MSRILVIGSFDLTSRAIGDRLVAMGVEMHYAAGNVDALQLLRMRSFGVVITNPETPIDEDLALLKEMREVRPGVKCIVLTPRSTPEAVIAALRERVFACFSAPYQEESIADLAYNAATSSQWRDEIDVVTARAGWVTLRANCHLLTADRLLTFARELNARLPESETIEMMRGLREILLNAMEHGTAFSAEQMIEITAVRTARAIVFYVRDPGPGFRRNELADGTVAGPLDHPLQHIAKREGMGMRPGGYGLTMAGGAVDELIYSDIGNEVVLIKYINHG
jgi:anti-sigma regulatory factor (Ser/Thr protein kinase)